MKGIKFWGREHTHQKLIEHSVITIMEGYTIIDDFDDCKHRNTRIRLTETGLGQHIYVQQYLPWNQDIFCLPEGDE